MRKGFITICLLLTVVLSAVAARTGKMPILGNECKYDTVLYRTVAPGVTLLQARFDAINNGARTYDMLVHLLEIDMTNQYNKFTPKLSCNGYYEWTSILMELQSEQRAGKKAVAAISGYSFTESGSGSGTTKVAEVRGPLISDGVVYHQDRGSILQYYYGADRMAYVGYAQLSGSVTVGSESWIIGQVNRFRDKVDGYGEISLFCNGLGKSRVSPDHSYSGADVKVKLLNSRKQVVAGEDIECEVVAVLDGGGNSFDDGEAMLSADGAMAEKLKLLTVGQKVTIAVNTVDGSGNKLDVEHLAPVFLGYAVKNGVANANTYNTNTATVILGVSADNTKTYIAVMDQNNSHATYRCFADFMANIGVYDAMYMDGGPSADMAVDDRVISDNLCSSDGGRALGSCFMLYSTAPDDWNVVRIEVDDDSERVMHVGDELKIMAWGYNQYDEMVRADVAATDEVTVTCTNNLGYWYNKKFVASQEGVGEIILTTKSGYTKRIPLAVEGRVDLQISPARIFTGEGRAVQAKLWYTERGNAKEVDPTEAVWSTYNDNVLKSVAGGLIEPWVLGGGTNRATVSAKYKGLTAEADVVVEDAAEGMGSRFNGQVLGTFGKYGVLSFNGNKMITTSGGGALICRNAEEANTIMWYATQARDAYPYYEHTAIGYNYRMSNVCAGIGRGQMTVLDAHIAHHKHVQELYKELFKDVKGVHLHEQPADPRYDANFWLCAATIDKDVHVKGQENAYKEVIKTAVGGAADVIKAVESATTDCQPNENVEALRVFMLGKKVECRPVWKPMHKQPVYAGCDCYTNGIEEDLFKVGFCLPAGPYVSDEDVRYIVDCIKEAITD